MQRKFNLSVPRLKGSDFSSFNNSVYHMPDSIQESFFRHNLRIFKDLMKENAWPELNKPEFIERIDEAIAKCTERGRRVCSPAACGYNVLNHGDFVLRNMLFRQIDGRIGDVRFVSTERRKGREHFSSVRGCSPCRT